MSSAETLQINAQLIAIGGRLDGLHTQDNTNAGAVDQLRGEVNAAILRIEGQMRAEKERQDQDRGRGDGGGGARGGRALMNDKDEKPPHFGLDPGRKDDMYFREWSKKIKLYLNGKRRGWRAIMTWAQNHTKIITQEEIDESDWSDRAHGNEELFEFLLKILHNDAPSIAQDSDCVDNGLEVFRKLHNKWDPPGAAHDAMRYDALMVHVKPAKSLIDLPRVVNKWHKDVNDFLARSKTVTISDEIRAITLLRLLPEQNGYAQRMREQFNETVKTYDVLKMSVLNFVQNNTVGNIGMMVDSLGRQCDSMGKLLEPDDEAEEEPWNADWAEYEDDWTPKEYMDYYKTFDDKELDALGKGKGKKGKGGAKGKGKKGKGAQWSPSPPASDRAKGSIKGNCWGCNKPGHTQATCPLLKGGKQGKGAHPLEAAGDGVDSLSGGSLGGLSISALDAETADSFMPHTCISGSWLPVAKYGKLQLSRLFSQQHCDGTCPCEPLNVVNSENEVELSPFGATTSSEDDSEAEDFDDESDEDDDGDDTEEEEIIISTAARVHAVTASIAAGGEDPWEEGDPWEESHRTPSALAGNSGGSADSSRR